MNNKSLNQEGINYMNRSMILNDLIEDMDESEEHKVGKIINPPNQQTNNRLTLLTINRLIFLTSNRLTLITSNRLILTRISKKEE